MNNIAKFAFDAIKQIKNVKFIDTYVGDNHRKYLQVKGIRVGDGIVEVWGDDGCGSFLASWIESADVSMGGKNIHVRLLLCRDGEIIIDGERE